MEHKKHEMKNSHFILKTVIFSFGYGFEPVYIPKFPSRFRFENVIRWIFQIEG